MSIGSPRSYRGWSAAFLLGSIAFWSAFDLINDHPLWLVAIVVLASALGGLATFLEPPTLPASPIHPFLTMPEQVSQNHGTFISRTIALLSIVLCWTGPVAFFLAILGLLLNRDVIGWPRPVCVIALFLCVPVFFAFIFVLAYFDTHF